MFSRQKRTHVKTLQVHSFIQKFICKFSAGRTSFSASFQRKIMNMEEASLTFEAAVILPFFICAVCSFFWLITVFRTQLTLQETMWRLSKELSGYAYLYEQTRNLGKEETEYVCIKDTGLERLLAGGITGQYVESRIITEIGRNSGVWDIISGGINGIHVESMLSLPDANGVIDLVVTYKVKNPFLPVPAEGMELRQRCYIKAWLGYDVRDEEEPESMAYIAETGEVYHLYSDCSYLKPNIMLAAYNMGFVGVGDKTYKACEVCVKKSFSLFGGLTVYITETGEKYHKDISCRTLKRTVYEIPLCEASVTYRLCTRCEKREEK